MQGEVTQHGGQRPDDVIRGPWTMAGEKRFFRSPEPAIPKTASRPASAFSLPDATPNRFGFPRIADAFEDATADNALSITWPDVSTGEKASACAAMADEMVRQLSGEPGASSTAWKQHLVVGLTSAGAGDGKTDLLLALARFLAERIAGGLLAVDANPRKPDLTKRLNVPNRSNARPKPLIYPTNCRRLHVMPMSSALRSCQFDDSWLEELQEAWPLTLLDMASLADLDAVSLAGRCDGVYLAVRLGYTSQRAIADARYAIDRAGGRLLGSLVVG